MNFDPIFKLSAELFTHLGIACESGYLSPNNMTYLTSVMNPGGRKSGSSSTPFSVSDAISMEMDTLLEIGAQEGFGIRKQAALKTLVCRKIGSDSLMC